MHAYCLININSEESVKDWLGTLQIAHEHAKVRFGIRESARIELVDIDTSKDGVLTLLNTGEPKTRGVMRTWALTSRGGLREVPNGE